jgi:hypothetical protein
MSHFAQIQDGRVVQVIVADQDFIDSGAAGDAAQWRQTSIRTSRNQHPEGRPLRGNFAGVGYIYDAANDVFYAPQPYPSWTIAAPTWTWTPPVAMPTDGKLYSWNESIKNWEITPSPIV